MCVCVCVCVCVCACVDQINQSTCSFLHVITLHCGIIPCNDESINQSINQHFHTGSASPVLELTVTVVEEEVVDVG